jgi:hypothetical protein
VSVTIEPIPDSVRLRISGDIQTTVAVPYEDDERFFVGLSDGTLLIGSYDDELRCKFDVARDGAGIVRLVNGATIIDWTVEWATVSAYDPNIIEPNMPRPMPLFPDIH